MMTANNTRLTVKQIQILQTIRKHWEAHYEDIDIDQLLDELPYETSKQSMQFSIRSLIKKGLILKVDCETRRGRSRRVIKITPFAKDMLNMGSHPRAAQG